MTISEAQRALHSYRADFKKEAEAKCLEINVQLDNSECDFFVPVNFGELGWTCMLASAYQECKKIGLIA
jgi:hypothetical protein